VKSAYDSGLFHKIFVTGSNSSFLNNEYSTLLSGRYLEEKVFPYSLAEILSHNNINSYFDAAGQTSKVLRLLDNCLEWGCFPEIAPLENSDLKSNLLKSYFDSIIMKDCISRYQIGDVATFKKSYCCIVFQMQDMYVPIKVWEKLYCLVIFPLFNSLSSFSSR